MKKTLFALILAAILSLVSWSAIAEADPLRTLADSAVPENAMYLSKEMDDGATEFKYWLPETQETMDVKVKEDRILRTERDVLLDEGSLQVTLTEDDILALILENYPGAQVNWIQLEKDDGLNRYKVHFTTPEYVGEVKIHPASGKTLEENLDFEAVRLLNQQTTEKQTASGKSSGSGSSSKSSKNTASKSTSSGSDSLISQSRAKEIALNKSGGGKVTYIKLDKDDGRQVYEGEIVYDGYEYEFEIDAKSGKILDWDRDRLDDDD